MSDRLMELVKSHDNKAFEKEFGDVQVFSLVKNDDGSIGAVTGIPVIDKTNEESSHE